ncbi:MAG TPA: hypothetical protein VG943_01115 [Caulobacterales bacterium]|nr:hypothetical protein [Caulobacterales bacterium]
MMCPAENPTSDPLKARLPSVLVVEGEVLIRLSIAEFLRDHDMHVVEASSPTEARSVLLAEVPIDVVFSDAHLADEDPSGPLALWLRENFPKVGLLLTAWASTGPFDQAADAPVCIEKPYIPEKVMHQIEALIARRKAQGT